MASSADSSAGLVPFDHAEVSVTAPFHPLPAMLLAAKLDWIEGLLPVLFVILWLGSQVIAALRRAASQKPPPLPGRRPAQPRPVEPAAGPGDPRDDLARQIEAFLKGDPGRQAGRPERPAEAGGRHTEPREGAGVRPQRREGAKVRPPERHGSGTGVSGRGATAGGPRAAGGAAVPPSLGDAGRAGGLLPREPAAAHALGGDVARHVDEAFASDLKHRIGPAGTAPAGIPATAVEPVNQFAALLRDGDALRRLVIIREVLDRPVERW